MLYIGIDPGVNTGMAVWDTSRNQFERILTCGIIVAMVEIVELYRYRGEEMHIVIEDARKRKWLPTEKNVSEYRGKLMGAGSVKRDCEMWEEFAKYYGFDITLLPPRKGLTKWTAATFNRVTGWKCRTSNHARDAAMLVFGK